MGVGTKGKCCVSGYGRAKQTMPENGLSTRHSGVALTFHHLFAHSFTQTSPDKQVFNRILSPDAVLRTVNIPTGKHGFCAWGDHLSHK